MHEIRWPKLSQRLERLRSSAYRLKEVLLDNSVVKNLVRQTKGFTDASIYAQHAGWRRSGTYSGTAGCATIVKVQAKLQPDGLEVLNGGNAIYFVLPGSQRGYVGWGRMTKVTMRMDGFTSTSPGV